MKTTLEILQIIGFILVIPATLGLLGFFSDVLFSMLGQVPVTTSYLQLELTSLAYLVGYGLIIFANNQLKKRG